MLVIVANNLPPSVRGILKIWFLEPKPNVFVTDINENIEKRIVDFLNPYFKEKTGLIVIKSDKKTIQGFTIKQRAMPKKKMITLSGLQFIIEKNFDNHIR